VPVITYTASGHYTTNATYYDHMAFQLVKTYHYVVVDRQQPLVSPGRWFVTVSNLPVLVQQSVTFHLQASTSSIRPCPRACSGRGSCQEDGKCACSAGWGDIDCAVSMLPIAVGAAPTTTHLTLGRWEYYYITLVAPGRTADSKSFVQVLPYHSNLCR
jgi:hypothetical protein